MAAFRISNATSIRLRKQPAGPLSIWAPRSWAVGSGLSDSAVQTRKRSSVFLPVEHFLVRGLLIASIAISALPSLSMASIEVVDCFAALDVSDSPSRAPVDSEEWQFKPVPSGIHGETVGTGNGPSCNSVGCQSSVLGISPTTLTARYFTPRAVLLVNPPPLSIWRPS